MKKLGLEKKYNEEVSLLDKKRDELVLEQKAKIEALTTSLNAKTIEYEELKKEVLELRLLKDENAKQKGYISILETNHTDKELIENLQKVLEENATLKRQVQYLSLYAPKKSEKQNAQKETSKSGESDNVSTIGESSSKTETKDKPKVKESKKVEHNGNNGARINKHEYDDIQTVTHQQYPELPEGVDMSQLEFIDVDSIVKFTAETKVEVVRHEYLVYTYKDKKTGAFYSGKPVETPLRGSLFTSSFVTLLIWLKFAVHISVSTIQKMLGSSNFKISPTTLNKLINKVAEGQFFRNIDKVLQLEILKSSYIIMDETFAKSKINIAQITQRFIKQFYIWVQLSMDRQLVRFSSSGGSRKCSVGYKLLEKFKGIVQSDAYILYKNLEKNILPNIQRIACIQHVKRGLVTLADTIPIARVLLDLYNKLYIMDHERERHAAADALAGKEWTLADHIAWRKKYAPEILDQIEEKLNLYSKDPTILPSSDLAKAINHCLSEMAAVRAIFDQEYVLCKLDSNDVECKNRSISKFRRISLAFGSILCGENQCIFFSLVESCHQHNVNVQEYFKFLLDKMPSMSDCIITDYDSPKYMEFRNLLPDVYAKEHPAKKPKKWEPTIDKSKPRHKGAQRKAYKKVKSRDRVDA